MISNHRSGPPAGRRFEGGPPPGGSDEKTLQSERIQIERKVFTLSLRENPRGRFLRITEDVSGRHDTVIIPAPGLEDFLRVLGDIVRTSNATPSTIPSTPPPPPPGTG
jgi:hypothetical protein